MATVDLSNLDHDFLITDQQVDYQTVTAFREPSFWVWTSNENIESRFIGTNLKYNGENPVGGTFTELHLNATPNPNPDDIAITGLSLPSYMLDYITTKDLPVDEQDNIFWSTVLAGDDTIDLGPGNTTREIRFAGDGRNVGAYKIFDGHDDHISGFISRGYVSGDFVEVAENGILYGGSDHIDISAGVSVQAYGDAHEVDGTLFAGNDELSLSGGGGGLLAGDAYSVEASGTVVGGDDLIDLRGGGNSAVGDVEYVFDFSTMIGGDDTIFGNDAGNGLYGDTFDLDSSKYFRGGNDIIHGGGGSDAIYGDYDLLDQYSSTHRDGGADQLYGDAGADTIYGNEGNDLLDGGTDADTMTGGLGSDTYIVDNAGDVVIENHETGVDEVKSSVSFSLAGQYIERLTLTGTVAIAATGNSFANTLDGSQNSASNTLTGKTGNDIYIVGANDKVVEASGSAAGTMDVVRFIGTAGQSFSLAGQYIERLELLGSAATNGTGNSQANTIVGNSASNIIAGGSGNDDLTGGGGKDFFLFNTVLNASTNVDIVHGYNVADDTFQLARKIFTGFAGYGEASAGRFFADTTGLAHDADDRIIYETDTGKLFYDADGTGATAGVHFATVATGLALTYADFFIV